MADPFTGGQTSRASNALQKRQESLKRWTTSETAKESADRSRKKTKIKFSLGTVFLSAVTSGDVEEVKKLLAKGADINHQNVDGLTALHQACIDENYDLVNFLVDHGARLDIRDNEGWSALHAAASCGSVEIAQCLIDHGADVSAVNNEGELPLDLAEEEDMEDLLTDEIERLGIDVDQARGLEERVMLEDAQSWTNSKTINEIKDKSGATALHVAASKGYVQVIGLLVQLGVDINAKDVDGWTPLHAAVHWGQNDACELLAEHGANFSARNKMGSTPIDLAEPDMGRMLEELKKRQNDKPKINASTTPVIKSNMESGPGPLKRRSSITRIKDQNLFLRDINQERKQMEANSKLSRPPSFHESPKEENEKEKIDCRSKDDSGTESDTEGSSEEESEEESDQEEETEGTTSTVKPVAPRPEVKSNSISPKPEEESESEDESGSESEETSSDEEDQGEEPSVKPDLRNSATISTKPAQNTSSSVPNQGMGGTSRLVKSPSIDNDKKPAGPSSLSKTERFRPSWSVGKEDRKDESTSPSLSYPTRTTAATTSNATSTTTTNSMGRANTTPSDDSQLRRTRLRRPATSNDRLDNGEEDKKSNDVSYSTAGGDNQRKGLWSQRSRDPTRRNWIADTGDDKNEADGSNKKPPSSNKDNEEPEVPPWKRRQEERREREKLLERGRKKQESESERRTEREKEKEKVKEEKEVDDSSQSAEARARRKRMLMEKRRPGSDEVEDAKKNDTDEKTTRYSWRRSPETRPEDAKSSFQSTTDRTRTVRPDSKGSFGSTKANAVTETDPQKMKERLQEVQLELQEYKIKYEKALQAKEELERKYSSVEEDLKQLSDLKADNQRLKDENGALIRVISKLSRPPT